MCEVRFVILIYNKISNLKKFANLIFYKSIHTFVNLQWKQYSWVLLTKLFCFLRSFICPAFHSRELEEGIEVSRRWISRRVHARIPFFSLVLFSSEGDEILFRGRMIYIKEMLFGNKQSSNEGRRQLGGALGWIILATQRKKTDESLE